MADCPLRPAIHRRFGEPLPHQLSNGTRAHLEAAPKYLLPLFHVKVWSYAVLATVSGCYPPLRGRLLTRYSPVRHSVCLFPLPKRMSSKTASFDLHVLSTPPAFVLSQDQTLSKKISKAFLLLFLMLRTDRGSAFQASFIRDALQLNHLVVLYLVIKGRLSGGDSYIIPRFDVLVNTF